LFTHTFLERSSHALVPGGADIRISSNLSALLALSNVSLQGSPLGVTAGTEPLSFGKHLESGMISENVKKQLELAGHPLFLKVRRLFVSKSVKLLGSGLRHLN